MPELIRTHQYYPVLFLRLDEWFPIWFVRDQLTHLYDRLQQLKDECPREKVGGKWSRKYKKRINCKRHKGFSQKQYCKYGRNKSSKKKRTVKRRRSRR